jgi:hypothetical protein
MSPVCLLRLRQIGRFAMSGYVASTLFVECCKRELFPISQFHKEGVVYGDAGLKCALQGALPEFANRNGMDSESSSQVQLCRSILL